MTFEIAPSSEIPQSSRMSLPFAGEIFSMNNFPPSPSPDGREAGALLLRAHLEAAITSSANCFKYLPDLIAVTLKRLTMDS